MVFLIFFIWILFDSSSDAFYDSNKKMLSGIIESIKNLGLLILLSLFFSGCNYETEISFVALFIGYILLRISIYNIIYNSIRKINFFYIGKTKIIDKIFNWFIKISKQPPQILILTIYILSVLLSIKFLITWNH